MAPVVLTAVSLAERVPFILVKGPLGYDDGVYGASAVAMRSGALPFRDVFSSQGPLFLPLVRIFDVLTLQRMWSPRTRAVAVGVALILLTFLLAHRMTTIEGAVASASLVTFSSTIFRVSSGLAADGFAAAFATAAVWTSSGQPTKRSRVQILVTGLLGGCAIAVKGPLIAPAIVAALWLISRRGGLLSAAIVGLVAGVVLLALSAPWGLGNVWRQFVELHIWARGSIDPITNLKVIIHHFIVYEPTLVLSFLIATGLMVVRLRERSKDSPTLSEGSSLRADTVIGICVWLALQGLLLLLYSPLFSQHLTYLVVPLALLGGAGLSELKHRWFWIAALVTLAASSQLAQSIVFRPIAPSPNEIVAMRDLRAVQPAAGTVITDEPGLAWWAGRDTPPDLVDTSNVRITAGFLTLRDVSIAASAKDVCAVLVWSGRFERLGRIGPSLSGYQRVRTYGDGQALFLRNTCALTR
jgi:hypothetical protein